MSDTLYEINSVYQQLLDDCRAYAEEHDGEISSDLAMRLDAVEWTREAKIENVLKYYKHQAALETMLWTEIDNLTKRMKAHANSAAWCKYLLAATVKPGEKLEYGAGRISWRSSKSVEILDPAAIPDEYTRIVPARREPDKVAIGDVLKQGKDVPGTRLNEKMNISIK